MGPNDANASFGPALRLSGICSWWPWIGAVSSGPGWNGGGGGGLRVCDIYDLISKVITS